MSRPTFSIPEIPTSAPTFIIGPPQATTEDPETTTTSRLSDCKGCATTTHATTTRTRLTTTEEIETTSSSSRVPVTSVPTPVTTSSTSTSTTLSTTSTTPLTTPTFISTQITTSTTLSTPVTTTTPRMTTTRTPTAVTEIDTVTQSIRHSSSASVPIAAASSSANPSSATKTSTGVLVGGIAAGVVLALGIAAALFYVLRRCRRARDDDDFDPDAFRRQSHMLPDTARGESPRPWQTSENASGSPRPPTMIQRHLASTPPMTTQYYQQQYAQQYQNPPSPGPFAAYAPPQAGWAPGQVISPNSSVPFYAGAYDAQAQVLPSPTVSAVPQYDSAYDSQGRLVRSPSQGAAVVFSRTPSPGAQAALNRAPSAGASVVLVRTPSPGAQAALSRVPSAGASRVLGRQTSIDIAGPTPPAPVLTRSGSPPSAVPATTLAAPEQHYVDLDRSSVTPFQAQQYTEISRKLAGMPGPLRVVNEDNEDVTLVGREAAALQKAPADNELIVSRSVEHGQALPDSPFADPDMRSPLAREQEIAAAAAAAGTPVLRMSEDELAAGDALATPRATFIEAPRAPSFPPTIPERSFSPVTISMGPYDFPMPSAAPPSAPVAAPVDSSKKRPDTVYTMYDPEDAYGGI